MSATHSKRWQALMAQLGFAPNLQTLEKLLSAYAEPQRHYHTQAHIDACLHHLDRFADYPINKAEMELSLWFHDAIYKPFSALNEAQSAAWAIEFLQEQNADEALTSRVQKLILVTAHNAHCETPEERAIVDIDLAILGAPEAIYLQFEELVRKEYRWVPSFIYRKKRRELLASFLERDTIFNSQQFQQQFEIQARQNLTGALQSLG